MSQASRAGVGGSRDRARRRGRALEIPPLRRDGESPGCAVSCSGDAASSCLDPGRAESLIAFRSRPREGEAPAARDAESRPRRRRVESPLRAGRRSRVAGGARPLVGRSGDIAGAPAARRQAGWPDQSGVRAGIGPAALPRAPALASSARAAREPRASRPNREIRTKRALSCMDELGLKTRQVHRCVFSTGSCSL